MTMKTRTRDPWQSIQEAPRIAVTALISSTTIDMDKDSRDDFTFAKLSDLKLPVTFRM